MSRGLGSGIGASTSNYTIAPHPPTPRLHISGKTGGKITLCPEVSFCLVYMQPLGAYPSRALLLMKIGPGMLKWPFSETLQYPLKQAALMMMQS